MLLEESWKGLLAGDRDGVGGLFGEVVGVPIDTYTPLIDLGAVCIRS